MRALRSTGTDFHLNVLQALLHQMKKVPIPVIKKSQMKLMKSAQHQPVGKTNNLNAIFVENAILRNIIGPITWTCTSVTDPLNVNTVPKLLLNLQFFVCIAKHIFHPLLNAITVQRCLPKNVIEIDTWEHTQGLKHTVHTSVSFATKVLRTQEVLDNIGARILSRNLSVRFVKRNFRDRVIAKYIGAVIRMVTLPVRCVEKNPPINKSRFNPIRAFFYLTAYSLALHAFLRF